MGTDTKKRLFALAVACAALLAVIGGTAYLFFDHHYLFGVTNILLSAMAMPYIVRTVKILWKDEDTH